MSIDLAKLRKQRGISQKDLADKVGYAAPTISNLENGNYAASEDLVEKLSKVLNVSELDVRQAIAASRAKAMGHGAPVAEPSRAIIVSEEPPSYNPNVEHEVEQYFPQGPEGIAKLKESIVDLAIELTEASPLMRRAGFPLLIAQANELKRRLAGTTDKPRIRDSRGNPLSSELTASLREGAKRGADLAQRELDRERGEPSPSEKADEPSGNKPSPPPGTGAHQKSPRSSPTRAQGSHAGERGDKGHHNK